MMTTVRQKYAHAFFANKALKKTAECQMHQQNEIPAILWCLLDRAKKVGDSRSECIDLLGSRGHCRTPCVAYRSQPESWTCISGTSGLSVIQLHE